MRGTFAVCPIHRDSSASAPHYHVASRGKDKQVIYLDDDDRLIFVELFECVVRRYGGVYAYCLMTNHYHIVLQIPDGGLSDGARLLNGELSRRTNSRHDRSGHLIRNRFSDRMIESEKHLYEACRYVDLNPVRAGLCESSNEWAGAASVRMQATRCR